MESSRRGMFKSRSLRLWPWSRTLARPRLRRYGSTNMSSHVCAYLDGVRSALSYDYAITFKRVAKRERIRIPQATAEGHGMCRVDWLVLFLPVYHTPPSEVQPAIAVGRDVFREDSRKLCELLMQIQSRSCILPSADRRGISVENR